MSKIVREKNKRDILLQRAAFQKKQKPFLNQHGMNAEQLRNKLIQTQSQQNTNPGIIKKGERNVVSRGNVVVSKRTRPDKQPKSNHGDENPHLLLDTPNIGTKLSTEYPVPEWFRFKGQADVSVIIPLYKSQNVVQDLIRSWDVNNDGLKVEAIFVDDNCPNSSKDIVIQSWQHRKNDLSHGVGKIIYNTANKGYGGACNTGADYASGKYIIYLNADTTVTQGWIKPIYDLFESDPNIGIIGNTQLKEGGTWHGTIDSAGSEWTWRSGNFVHIGRHTYDLNELPMPFKPEEVPADLKIAGEREMVTGCCLAIPATLNREIGGFNPNYRVGYWEDADICLTVRELGWKVMHQPDSVIYHKLGHTNSGAHSHHDFNRNFFWNKWVNSGRIDSLIRDKRNDRREIKSILLQRKGARGDVLVASYVAGALKKRYPGAKIAFYTQCPEVLRNCPHIDRVFNEKQFSERQFQLIYNLDMVYEYRPYTNILKSYAEAVGVKIEDCIPTMVAEGFDNLPDQAYVAIHAGKTAWVGRDWKRSGFDEIARKLMQSGKKVICVGNDSDYKIPCDIDLRGKTTIPQLAGVLKTAEAFIGVDSFPFHVAQAVETKAICYFGSVLPEYRIYRDNAYGINVSDLPCIGCHHRKPRPSVVTNTCETGTFDCEHLMTIEMFWAKIQEVL